MDPLSITASIAGLLSLAGATAATLDALFRDFKSRPAVLSAISQEISALCLVLGQLEGQLRTGPKSTAREENEKALSAVLDLCMRTFQQIGSQINELQSRLRKGTLSKAYTFMLYPSRMKEISSLRDDLEKYKVTLLLALQMHKPRAEDSTSLDALRREVEDLRSKMLGVRQPLVSVDLERMDVVKSYIEASSETLFGDKSSSSAVITEEGQVGPVTAPPLGNVGYEGDDVPTFGSFNGWLSTFSPNPETPDPEEDELLSAFRNRKKTNSANNRAPPIALDTVEVASQAEMIPTSDTLSLVSQHLPIRQDIPDGKIHLVFVNLRKSRSDNTFTEEVLTSPDIPLYKLIHDLHLKGYTTVCGFQTIDRQSTYGPMIPHDSLLQVAVSADSSNYNIKSGLQINIDERLIDFYNRFMLDDPATPTGDLISVKRCKDNVHIYDGRFNDLHLRLQRTLRVPEDGKPYPLPAYFGSYPLLSVETFSDRLPPHMRKKGGLFIPMFQREALSLDFGQGSEECFAIRIYAGSVNAISGKPPQNQANEGDQDYIVAPKQRRLDGFLAGKGVVKQFVAMPLGFGYSVEKQVTGMEFIGGVQLEIIPRLSDKVKFIRPQRNTTRLPQQLDTSEDLFKTPRELGMGLGQLLLMQDGMTSLKSKRAKFDLGFLKDGVVKDGVVSDRQDLLPVYEEICRPTFVHEMFLGTGQHSYSKNESLVLHPMEPLSLRVDWQSIMSTNGTIVEEYSPFLHISDFKTRITSIKMKTEPRPWRTGYILFNGTAHKGYPKEYSPLTDYVSEGGVISWKNATLPRHDQASEVCGAPAGFPSRDPSWEMALGAGGNLGQSIEKTNDGRLWDWGASKLLNIQILNSVAFKEFTGASPVTPISFREYVTAKIPFYSFLSVSENSMIGDHATVFKSIGQLDHSAVIQVGIRVNPTGKPVGCANCEDNICDTILQPCKHAFCSDCVKFTMKTDSSITCAFCSEPVSNTIAFSAPMEMPSFTPKEQPNLSSIEPVIPCREADKTCATSSPLITQQGDRKSSSSIVNNVIAVLFEMVRDGESPKDLSDWKISELVADSITAWGYTVPFDVAIRNLTQTSIDIRIPIFKAGLQKAIKSGTIHHVKQLLLLVPNVDDLGGQDTGFVSAVISAAANHTSFTLLFKWLASGRRSIEDLGLTVRKLLTLIRFDDHDGVDTLLKYVAGRKQTLSECDVSILSVSKDETYKISKLVEHGCDPNLQDADGKTLLHLKVHSANSLETFLALGLRIDIVDNDGNTCIHLAVPKAYPCIATLLKHKSCTPATVNIRNREGLTAYHLSLKVIKSASVRQWFLDAGADPSIKMPEGQFRDEVVAMLRKQNWVAEGFILDDGLIRELQGTAGDDGSTNVC